MMKPRWETDFDPRETPYYTKSGKIKPPTFILPWPWILLAVGILLLIVSSFTAIYMIANHTTVTATSPTAIITPVTQEHITGQHLKSLQVGTSFNPQERTVQGKKSIFRTGETLYVVFQIQTQDEGAEVALKLFQDGHLADTSTPLTVEKGDHVYSKTIDLKIQSVNLIEIDYNGISEGNITFTVSNQ